MKDFVPGGRPRSVLDRIHGLVRLSEEEVVVMEHPVFQRLARVRQNGLLYFVFPGATHTRFEHSLGVLYVAHSMVRNLALNSQVATKKRAVDAADAPQPGRGIDLSGLSEPDLEFLHRVVRMAALAHDLGHGPLSHTFDRFAVSSKTFAGLLDDPLLEPLRQLAPALAPASLSGEAGEEPVKHELMSCAFFAVAAAKLKDPGLVTAVAASLLGPPSYRHLREPQLARLVPLIHDIIASAPADADRMDYMERDSRSIGVTYGLFDRPRVLKSLLCYVDAEADGTQFRLGLKRSGLRAIENLLQARFELFVQVYYHKTNRAIQLMLETIAGVARQRGLFLFENMSLSRLIDEYVELDDEQFLRTLRGTNEGPFSGVAEVNSIAADLSHRKLWKRIEECESRQEAYDLKRFLAAGDAEADPYLLIDDQDPRATKDLADGARLLDRGSDGVYSCNHVPAITQASALVRSLGEAEQRLCRLYFAKADSTAADALRKRAWEFQAAKVPS